MNDILLWTALFFGSGFAGGFVGVVAGVIALRTVRRFRRMPTWANTDRNHDWRGL